MYQVRGPKISEDFFGSLEPKEILYEFDSPKIFTFLDQQNRMGLAVQSDEDESNQRFLVVYFSEKLLEYLKKGAITLYEALDQPRLWIVDISHDGNNKTIWLSDLKLVPGNRRPSVDAMLWPSLQPKLVVRILHNEAKLGSVPSNLIQNTVERAKKSFRTIAEHVATSFPEGSDIMGGILNPPAQRFAYNSFEASFQLPEPKNEKQTEFLDKFIDCFSKGFPEIEKIDEDNPDSYKNIGESIGSSEDRLAILTAMKEFAPAAKNPIEKIEISGTLVRKATPTIFTPGIYKILRDFVVKEQGEDIMVQATGKILECDKGKLHFELRDIIESSNAINSDTIKCQYESNIAEDVMDAFNGEYNVQISGVIKKNNTLVVDRIIRHKEKEK